MPKTILPCLLALGFTLPAAHAADPALTIYNENFAVVRETVPLDLKAGLTDVRFDGVTAHVEPASVILRDPSGKVSLRVVEQNYRFQPVSQAFLLSRYEGRTLTFLTTKDDGKPGGTVEGKVIRSGYVPRQPDSSGNSTTPSDVGESGSSEGPIIEVDGKLRFSLPGEPLFPALADDAILRPRLDWKIYSKDAVRLDAELAYMTTSMDWHADYSVIAPEDGDALDIVGLVTITNRSGRAFEHARIKLMAGDINKIEDNNTATASAERVVITGSNIPTSEGMPPAITVKTFDEYHLYSLPLSATLLDQETKQVEFTRATGVPSKRVYVYDGWKPDEHYGSLSMEQIRADISFGVASTTKVRVLREFKNTEANGLGIALPKGKLRFYRRDADGQLEFTGENLIDHTPKDETLSIYSGDAFDVVGSRKQTNFNYDEAGKSVDESFEITLRNHKKEPVEIRVVEHLFRGTNWTLVKPAVPWTKLEAQTMELRVTLQPDEEKSIGYTVHYSW